VRFKAEDLDNDEEVDYIGCIKNYKFKDDFKKQIIVFLKECKKC